MKKSTLWVGIIVSLLLWGCFSRDDDGLDRTVRLTISDAISFDNKQNYVVGDTLVFELKFSRYLKEDGYPNLLDVFETSGAEEFDYSFGVSKFSEFSNDFEPVNIDPNFILGKRTDDSGYYGYGGGNMAATLNEDRSEYISKVGIILVESGRFKLNLDFIRLSNGYDKDRVNVGIEHIPNIENPLVTEFMVLEN